MSPQEAKEYGIIDEVYTATDSSLISEAIKRGALPGEGPAESADERERDGGAKPAKG
jgi:hypothetical protein